MYNYTLLEKYKTEIKVRYEIEKDGDYSYYLKNPSRGKLRDLCWMIFEKGSSKEDLNVFCTLLGLAFDLTNKDKFKEQKDKFRPIETFFKGKTDPTNIDTINLAAILIDFNLRPFAKFKAKYIEESKEMESFKEKELFVSEDEEKEKEKSVCDKEWKSLKKEENLYNENMKASSEVVESVSSFTDLKKELTQEENKNTKQNILIIIGMVCLIFLVYYFAQQKQCMQWSSNHYELVDCNLDIQGIGTYNVVQPFDERIINLRRIQVSDTTSFFKNGEAVIWYVKVGDSLEFFNTHGRHPENKKLIKPVTQYIVDKYLLKDKDE